MVLGLLLEETNSFQNVCDIINAALLDRQGDHGGIEIQVLVSLASLLQELNKFSGRLAQRRILRRVADRVHRRNGGGG